MGLPLAKIIFLCSQILVVCLLTFVWKKALKWCCPVVVCAHPHCIELQRAPLRSNSSCSGRTLPPCFVKFLIESILNNFIFPEEIFNIVLKCHDLVARSDKPEESTVYKLCFPTTGGCAIYNFVWIVKAIQKVDPGAFQIFLSSGWSDPLPFFLVW